MIPVGGYAEGGTFLLGKSSRPAAGSGAVFGCRVVVLFRDLPRESLERDFFRGHCLAEREREKPDEKRGYGAFGGGGERAKEERKTERGGRLRSFLRAGKEH